MLERDFETFSTMHEDVCAFYPTAKAPTPGQKAMFFRALSDLTIAQVRAGFDAHVRDPQRGRFAPLPADVIAQVEGRKTDDRRPGPEEAWAIASQAIDEDKTLVWTDEIAQAWGIALPLHQRGDEIGARMAFKEAYQRLVSESRAAGRPSNWTATIGQDPAQRDMALQRAHVAGLLSAPERLRELPSPHHAMSLSNRGMPEHVKTSLQALRDRLANPADYIDEEFSTPSGHINLVPEDSLPPAMRKGAQA